jgi:bifunctional non-homologous end joining protein LigD
MARRPPSSKRQYVQALNRPAKLMASRLPQAQSGPRPDFIPPMLATAAERVPSGAAWVHEIKHDGYRLQLHKSDAAIACFTRRGHDWTARFPTLRAAALKLPADSAVIDGEAVVITAEGRTDFSALESYVAATGPERARHHLVFYAFDLLYVDGWRLADVPLIERKRILLELLAGEPENSPLRYSEHIDDAEGPKVLRSACEMELEGIVSKRKDGRYRSSVIRPGSR